MDEQNKPSGKGRFFYKNGDIYDGSWKYGQTNGYGYFFFKEPRGDVYAGNFAANKRLGWGEYVFKNKTRQQCNFVEDVTRTDEERGELCVPHKTKNLI